MVVRNEDSLDMDGEAGKWEDVSKEEMERLVLALTKRDMEVQGMTFPTSKFGLVRRTTVVLTLMMTSLMVFDILSEIWKCAKEGKSVAQGTYFPISCEEERTALWSFYLALIRVAVWIYSFEDWTAIATWISSHFKRIRKMDVFMTMLSIPAALAYVLGTAVIGLSLLSIWNALNQGNYPNVILFGLLSLGEIFNMLIVSLIGKTLVDKTIILRDELDFIELHKLNLSNKKTMLNFQTAITEPLSLKIAGLEDMNMDTFSSIMNSAYSFFNLVNAQ
ncbi:hypothetical protein GE061_009961 [Apolygus lucorum]|uniref:Uncharacterized protein n=1 Tax=Apolygus lucorum TaxID=248454 RepID=A0A8S9Y395_APOLU|nr:hypothetical protein GE061_009961 [Apolygus lucorum]